jgi:hypothetical protein
LSLDEDYLDSVLEPVVKRYGSQQVMAELADRLRKRIWELLSQLNNAEFLALGGQEVGPLLDETGAEVRPEANAAAWEMMSAAAGSAVSLVITEAMYQVAREMSSALPGE